MLNRVRVVLLYIGVKDAQRLLNGVMSLYIGEMEQ